MIKEDTKFGIAGVGMVGGEVSKHLKRFGDVEVIEYDKGKNIGSIEELNKADIIFICVPTNRGKDGECDISQVKAVIGAIEGEKTIVIKSTVAPGTTKKLAEEYQQHRFYFNPEFLSEATAGDDFNSPERQIIGIGNGTEEDAKELLALLPQATYAQIIGSSEAEMIKYVSNTFYALKVIFANEIFDVCEKAGIDYEQVKLAIEADSMIGENHFEIWHKGFRGFGTPEVSKCLPKDLEAFIIYARGIGINPELLRKVKELNQRLNVTIPTNG